MLYKKKDGGIRPIAVRYTLRRLAAKCANAFVFVKLDFTNAFNSVRRDAILTTVAEKMPELCCFTCDSLGCNPQLIIGENIIISAEGLQQGDPLSELQFCESIQSMLTEREARTKLGFVDDIDLEGEVACSPEMFRLL